MLSPEAPRAALGTIVFDGLAYEVNPDGTTVSLVGWHGTAPTGDISVPSQVTSGPDAYTVTAVKIQASGLFVDASVESLTLPETIKDIDDGAFESCPSLKYIQVSPRNENFASFDGMLFTKNLERLLSVPEGKEGAAHIPDQTTLVPALSISRCARLSSVEVGEGSAAFASRSGYLYSKEMKTLIASPASPASASASVVLPAEVEALGAHALAGCKNLASVTALGFVREIDSTAFADEAKSAVVALPAGKNYDERKAVWEAANFKNFAEPAEPGATVRPSVDASDGSNSADSSISESAASSFVFTLLDDYTLSVVWEGEEDPAAALEIPASADIDGVTYRVSAIAPNAFANRGSLTSVKLPAGVTSIGEAAFAGCANLASVQLPETLREVGERAFEATALTDLWLPASVQTIGPRAFAACESLTRLVALGTPNVADDALTGCANLSVYCPSNADGVYPWNLGLVANGNHLMPYGLGFSHDPLVLEVGQEADLFEGGLCEAPEGSELSYSYAAKPLSVEAGSVTGKAQGASEVTAVLTLDGIELARANRTVEVKIPASEATKTPAPLSFLREEEISPLSEGGISLFATGGTAVGDTFTSGSLNYKITSADQKTVEVTSSPNASGYVSIPEKVSNGTYPYSVTAIGNTAFVNNSSLVNITIPGSIKTIGNSAFEYCTSLNNVNIPSSVETIKGSAFQGCSTFTSVTVPDSVKTLEACTFQECDNLESANIPTGMKTIAGQLFAYCPKLTSVTIPDSVTTIESSAFDSCTSLHIDIPDSVTIIEESAFYNCSGILGGIPAFVKSIGAYAFSNCDFDYISIPDSVETIGDGAFEGCPIIELGIGSSVSSLPASIFKGNMRLERIDVQGNITSIDSNAFSGVSTANVKVHLLNGADKSVWTGAGFSEANITYDAGAPTFKDGALTYKVTSVNPRTMEVSACDKSATDIVTISSNVKYFANEYAVTAIGQGAFSRCENLTSVNIPNTVTAIGMDAFAYSAFTSMVIPDSVTSLGQGILFGCSSLSSATIGSGVTSLPLYIFGNDYALRDVYVKGNIGNVHIGAFSNEFTKPDPKVASNVTVYLPPGSDKQLWINAGLSSDKILVEGVGSTFTQGNLNYKITSLSPQTVEVAESPSASGNVDIPYKVTYGAYGYDVTAIAEGAFRGAKLTSVVIPSSVTAIGGNAFSQCASLSSVSISSNVTTLEWSVFSECTSLTSVTIPNSVTTINEYAFYNCPLSSVTIPASVKTINGSAFNGCASLTTFTVNSSNQNFVSDGGVLYTKNKTELIRYPQGKSGSSFTIPDSVTTIKNDAFYGCSKLTSLSIPNSVTYIGNYAFGSSALTSLTIPDSVTSIGNSIAMNCPITSFTLGSSLSSLPLLNFADLTKLENIYVRGNVTSIVSPGWSVSVPTNAKIHLLSGAGKGVWTGAGFNEANITYDAPAPTFENGILSYKVTSVNPNAVEVSACDKSATGIVTIGSSVKYFANDYAVTAIGLEAFAHCENLTSVNIPNSVTSIGKDAFAYSSITSMVIPDSVTTLGQGVFYTCTSLSSVTIGSGVTSVPVYFFGWNHALRDVYVKGNITSVDKDAFWYASSKSEINVYLPDGSSKQPWIDAGLNTDKIWVGAVTGSIFTEGDLTYKITSTSPTTVAVSKCNTSAKNALSIPKNVNYAGKPYAVTSIGESAFGDCTGLTSITIPNSITAIGNNAFQRTALTTLSIPESVTSIGYNIVFDCGSLTSIDVSASNQNYSSDNGVLYNKNKTELIRYPQGKTATSFVIPDSVTSVGDHALYACTSLQSVTVPNAVSNIEIYAFDHCTSLTSINIPSSVTTIKVGTFNGCSSLSSIDIPYSVATIERDAFWGCTSLASATIGSSVSALDANAFNGDTNLKNLYVQGNITSIDGTSFSNVPTTNVKVHLLAGADQGVWTSAGFNAANIAYDATAPTFKDGVLTYKVTSVNPRTMEVSDCEESATGTVSISEKVKYGALDYAVTAVGREAFYFCESIASVNIPDSVTSLENRAFAYSGLASVVIPDSVKTIGISAFESSHLSSITLGNSVQTIGAWAFQDTGHLASHFVIPDSVTTVGDGAFLSCSITSITIPDSVTNWGDGVFEGSGLTSIEIPKTMTTIPNGFLTDCSALTSITIPDWVTVIGNVQFFAHFDSRIASR